jgi:hypothetical protein
MRKAITLLFMLVSIITSMPTASAQAVREPTKKSAERVAILDALRPAVEAELRGDVEFVVTKMRVSGNWAFAQADPQRPGGGVIDPEETAFAGSSEFMDGLTIYALMTFSRGRWNLVDHLVGPTDVGYADWPERYGAPPVLFGLQ